MPGRPQSLAEYGYDRIEQFHHFGALVQQPATIFLGDSRLVVQGLLIFGQRQQAGLWVYEVVEIGGRVPTRVKYGYHLSYDNAMAFRYDRDSQHADMVEHKHLPPDERRVRWGAVSLQEVVDEAMDIVAEREEEEERQLAEREPEA